MKAMVTGRLGDERLTCVPCEHNNGRVNGDGRFRVIEHFGSQEDPTVVDDHFYAGKLKLEPVGNS